MQASLFHFFGIDEVGTLSLAVVPRCHIAPTIANKERNAAVHDFLVWRVYIFEDGWATGLTTCAHNIAVKRVCLRHEDRVPLFWSGNIGWDFLFFSTSFVEPDLSIALLFSWPGSVVRPPKLLSDVLEVQGILVPPLGYLVTICQWWYAAVFNTLNKLLLMTFFV